jgi:hypothetical protein
MTPVDDADSVSADGGTVSAYARLRFEAREVPPGRIRIAMPRLGAENGASMVVSF